MGEVVSQSTAVGIKSNDVGNEGEMAGENTTGDVDVGGRWMVT